MDNQKAIDKILNSWQQYFGENPSIIVKAPGRINLIGEHTDYNNGFVLPAAIDKGVYVGIAKNNHKVKCNFISLDKNESFYLNQGEVPKYPAGSWKNYIIGIVNETLLRGKKLSGFDVVFFGDIPLGAGLSSSAALENSLVFAINELFTLQFSRMEMIQISLKAEHKYAGVKCGIMDQFASMMGVKNKALLLDCKDLTYFERRIDLNDYDLILINSNVRHYHADSGYNTRRRECESVVEKLHVRYGGINSIRDITEMQFKAAEEVLTEKEYNRVKYILEENERVLNASRFLNEGNFEAFGNILFEAHDGMKELYEITCPELDFLVESAEMNDQVLGSRMMGGGFGGCTINLIKKGKLDLFVTDELKRDYALKFDKKIDIIQIRIGDGTNVIWNNN